MSDASRDSRSALTTESVCCNWANRSSSVIGGAEVAGTVPLGIGGVPGIVRLGDVEGVESGSEEVVEFSRLGDSGSVWASVLSSSESSKSKHHNKSSGS